METTPLRRQFFGAIERQLVIDQRGARFIQIVLRLLNFFRSRAVLQFIEIGPRIFDSAPGLFVGRAKFIVFQPHQDLAFFDLVAFFHADPRQTASHLGIHVDRVVGHDVAGGGEHDVPPTSLFCAAARATSTSGASAESSR